MTLENSLQAFQTDSKLRLRPIIRHVSGTKLFIFRCVCTPAFFSVVPGLFFWVRERDRVKVRDAGRRILHDASPAQRGSGLIQLAPLPPPLPLWLNINVTGCQQGLWLSLLVEMSVDLGELPVQIAHYGNSRAWVVLVMRESMCERDRTEKNNKTMYSITQ